MTLIQAVVLAAVQAITEFLPISSSAHLVLVPRFLGWTNLLSQSQFQIGFDVALHFGSLIALILYFREDLLKIIKSLLPGKDKKLLLLLLIATIPAFLAGFFLERFFSDLFKEPVTVAVLLIVTGFILLSAEMACKKADKSIGKMSFLQSFIIGIGQAIAIAPGISRSGTTISFGVLQNLKREEAARFSFLLAIPAIAGAAVFTVFKGDFIINTAWAAGLVVSAMTSFLVIKYFLDYLKKGRLLIFAYYCWFIGILSIILIKTGIV